MMDARLSERRSITVSPDLKRKILHFRAFLMEEGEDVDFTTAFGLLADIGFSELFESGFNARALKPVEDYLGVDEARAASLSQKWKEWLRREKLVVEKGSPARPTEGGYVSPARSRGAAARRPVSFCMRCKTNREMMNPVATTFKNGRKGYRGFCAVCGAKMTKFGS